MGFCTKCGRQRTGTAQFCTGCGARFSDAVDEAPPAAQPQPEPAPAGQTAAEPGTASQTAAEPVPAAGTIFQPAESADGPADWAAAPQEEPSAVETTRWDTHWYKPGQPAVPQPPAAPAEAPPPAPPAEPVGSGPSSYGPPSYGPPSYGPGQAPYEQPPHQPPPHVTGTGTGTGGTSPLRRGQTAILITLLVVVLLAVGGGAYALVSHFTGNKSAAPPSTPPTRSAPATPTAAATTPTSSPTATATTSPTTSPTGSPTTSPTASPKVSSSPEVSVAPGVTSNPAEPAIAAFLDRYFTAINTHDYAAYSSLLDSQEQSVNTRSSFEAGYGTTRDSAETLISIADTGGGNEAATVSFTSHQSPAESASKTACTSWTITLYLQPNGGSYLIGPAPAGYLASYQAC